MAPGNGCRIRSLSSLNCWLKSSILLAKSNKEKSLPFSKLFSGLCKMGSQCAGIHIAETSTIISTLIENFSKEAKC